MCSQYMKCPTGYRCKKIIEGAATGSCAKIGIAEPIPTDKEKEAAAPCETMRARDVCEKAEHCNWPSVTDACVLKCELRETNLDCQRPGFCLWVPQTGRCISREPSLKPQ
jgi:hypothetical protein